MKTTVVSLESTFNDKLLKLFYNLHKNEVNSYILLGIDNLLNRGSDIQEALKQVKFNVVDLAFNHFINTSFNWSNTGTTNYYNKIFEAVGDCYAYPISTNSVKVKFRNLVDLNRKIYPPTFKDIKEEVSFTNSAGEELTLNFVKHSLSAIYYVDLPVGDENFNYFMYNGQVFEVDLFNDPKSNYSTELIKLLSNLGEAYVDKLISIPKDSPDYLFFVEIDNDLKIKGINNKNVEVSLKFTRYLSKFPDIFSNKDCELIAAHLKNKLEIKVEIVSGTDIVKYYDESSYQISKSKNSSTLHKSCMRNSSKRRMLDLYVNNPDTVKLVVALKDDLVCARALLWKTDQGITLLDRIYYDGEECLAFMISQANLNGWHHKTNQDFKSPRLITFNGVDLPSRFLSVSLDLSGINHYPYIDTFHFVNSNGKKLYNSVIGHSIRVLQDQYGKFPFGRDVEINVFLPPQNDRNGNLIEIGTHWFTDIGRLVEKTSGWFYSSGGTSIEESVLQTSKVDFPYENKYGLKTDSSVEILIDFTGADLLHLPSLDFLDYINAKAYTNLLIKETVISSALRPDEIVFEDLTPRQLVEAFMYGQDVAVLLNPLEQIDLANRYGVSIGAKLNSNKYLTLYGADKKVYFKPLNFKIAKKAVSYKSLLNLIELDPEIYMRVVNGEKSWRDSICEYYSLIEGCSTDSNSIVESFDESFSSEPVFGELIEFSVTTDRPYFSTSVL